jgi:parallel beta-helix repeat protein
MGKLNQHINVKSFPNPNVIAQNYNQGILIVEGSSAKIIANKIDGNIKANIALGGQESGKTRIKYNYIENSKQEGIFVIDGEQNLLIEDNQIEGNNDGIVLVNSNGQVRENSIKTNQRSGILTASKTTAYIDSNIIEDNLVSGILIKDPSTPLLRRNEIAKNFFQL